MPFLSKSTSFPVMLQKILLFSFILLLAHLQYQIWQGSYRDWQTMQQRLAEQQAINAELQQRNQALIVEVQDLKQGVDSIEEYARMELGLIKQGEVFYQIVE